jgi:hypothetical protein
MNAELKKEQRIDDILLSLKKLDYLSRSQIQRLHRLGGTRNANRFLKSIRDYVHTFRSSENIYYLSKEGRERVGTGKICKRTPQVNHYVMRNALYLTLGCPADWRNEIKLKVGDELTIIADALFKRGDRLNIVEVDYAQKMAENRLKVEKYKRLVSLNVFMIKPKFYWVTTTEYRRKQIRELCEGLDVEIYLAREIN